MQEEWRPVVGFEGVYEVSNLGYVKRVKKGRGTKTGILKAGVSRCATSYGNIKYNVVVLCVDGATHTKSVHRLVAEAFIPNPENKPTVNHIDGNGLNNSVENLEWATQSEQETHKWNVLKHPIKNRRFGHKSRPIRCIENDTTYRSMRLACRELGVDRKDVYAHLKGERSSVKGLHFERFDV